MFSNVLPAGGYTILNMSEEEIKTVESRMRPGHYSSTGFLSNKESLKEVCERDWSTLNRLNISCDKIRDTIVGILKHSEEKVIKDRFKISGCDIATNGYQECPFQKTDDPCHKGRKDYVFTNLKTGESIGISQLAIDLIGHGFFEGDVEYRVDPEKVCRVLEIKPGEYKRVKERTFTWDSGEFETEAEESIKKYAESHFKIDDDAVAYLGVPFNDLEKYENRGLTEEQAIRKKAKRNEDAEESIQFHKHFIGSDLNARIVCEDKKYCYVFNHKERKRPVKFQVEGVEMSVPLEYKGRFIFEIKEEFYAEIT